VSHLFGLAIESIVAILLLLTICYCMLLNKRLKRLRADEQSLRATISELITATEIAERAIGGLKVTVRECDKNLGSQLASGTSLAERLGRQIHTGEEILDRLSQIALAVRPAQPEPVVVAPPRVSGAKAIVAAAQAFAERQRTHGLAA